MATKRKPAKRPRRSRGPRITAAEREDLELAEELLRVSRKERAAFVAGWDRFLKQLMKQQGIRCKPIGAKKLQEMLLKRGFDPESNEFSQGIVAMREE